MNKRLYVGNLPFATTEARLEEVFAQVGPVVETVIIYDRETNRSRGFGFVEMADETLAATAMEQMNGKELDGRTMTVAEARRRETRREPRRDTYSYNYPSW